MDAAIRTSRKNGGANGTKVQDGDTKMPKYSPSQIRNVALIGHGGSGKTTLLEALLFKAGAIKRMGSIADGNTVSDFDPEEKERGISIELSLARAETGGKLVNFLDAPGYADFVAGAIQAVSAADTALITVNAARGVEVMTRHCWDMARRAGTARIIAVTRMDAEHAHFFDIAGDLRRIFGSECVPMILPVGQGGSFSGVVNLLSPPASPPAEVAEKIGEFRGPLIEAIVSSDDALMERYLAEEKISDGELKMALSRALLAGTVVPIVAVSAGKCIGVAEILDLIAECCPGADARPRKAFRKIGDKVEEKEIPADAGAPFYAQVFKVKRDPYVGKLCFFRVYSGTLAAGSQARQAGATRSERFANLFAAQGKEQLDMADVGPGDIAAVGKIDSVGMGDTITTDDGQWEFHRPVFPAPMVSLAVEPKSRNDEAKVSTALKNLAEGDPTFTVTQERQTKELVIRGMGQMHLEVMLSKLKKAGVEVLTRTPKIPYLETVTGTSDVRYRHKKQTGGAGQFGECAIKLEPGPRGSGLTFLDEIVGGAIPNQFIPSVEKGIRNKMEEGVLAGYPVVDVVVHLYDGKSHPVDSKDIAFQIAGREAFKEAFMKARPVLLEPIVNMEIVAPSQFMGDITGNISGRRGRVSGMDVLGDMQVVKAQAPLAEVMNYSTELRALTGGEGYFSMEFSHYEVVPPHIQQNIVAAAKKSQEEDKE
ncbi:MAG: elongation factor G [Planctomycetota bacterium]|nr:elongation factor G [Planctomycetota bacterium]